MERRPAGTSAQPILVRLGLTLGLLLVLLAPMAVGQRPSAVASAVTLSTIDRLLAPPRGTPEKVNRFAEANRATRPTETRRYIDEIYRLAPLVGLDPAIVVAQSSLETAGWTSFYWTNHLNPAGIRITSSGVPSYTWETGAAAARYHLVHLYIYAAGAIEPTNPLYQFRKDGSGYQQALKLGYGGQARTIDDLAGRWAVDPAYADKIVSRGNAIFGPSSTDAVDPRVTRFGAEGSVGSEAAAVTDGDAETSWSVAGLGGPPTSAALTIDLRRYHRITSIRWTFGVTEQADRWELQTSPNGTTWTSLADYANAPVGAWQIHDLMVTARYVRFALDNPNDDPELGGIAEVEVYGTWTNGAPPPTATPFPFPTATVAPGSTATPSPTAAATATPSPTAVPSPKALAGEPLAIVDGGGSGTGNGSRFVRDADVRTTWQTISSAPPSQAQVYVDLGRVRSITGVEWLFRRTSGADSYAIQVSTDKVTWTPMSSYSGSTPLAWQRAAVQAEARYVRFVFANPGDAASLGYLAEIIVYGDAVAAGALADKTPTATGTATSTATSTATARPASTTTAVPAAPATPAVAAIAAADASPIAAGVAAIP